MEEKKISEQESLELINQMIEQTRRDSTVGSGNTFLIWGYVCMVVSLAVFVAAYTGPGAGDGFTWAFPLWVAPPR